MRSHGLPSPSWAMNLQRPAHHQVRPGDGGVIQQEIIETNTHLAFYAGWPNVFSALPVVKGIFEGRK